VPVRGLDSLRAWCRYDGPGRAVVLAVKQHGRRDLARWLAAELAPLAPPVDRVVWVPASSSGRQRRGYDQSALLARGLGRALGVPAGPGLRRDHRTGSQRGRTRAERLEGLAVTARRPVQGRVLLVDDVVTTGASLSAAAAALRRAGAGAVHGLVVAVADRDFGPSSPWSADAYGEGTGTGRGVHPCR
jgi:competence protein ComFC